MKKVLFCGCSYTQGACFDLEHREPGLWVNLLHQQGKFSNFELTNVAVPGRSNSGIFQDAVYNLVNTQYDYAVVTWTSMPRYEVVLGVETYSTRRLFAPNVKFSEDVHCNDISYSKNYLQKINDRFTALATHYKEILDLVYYVNSLVNLSKKLGTKVFFVNGLCPWDTDYFVRLDNVLPCQYTEFTKKLLNIDNRDDEEIFVLYNKIHQEYSQIGGIRQEHWLNLYNSLRSLCIDVNNDKVHPGIKSNQLYFELLNQQITL